MKTCRQISLSKSEALSARNNATIYDRKTLELIAKGMSATLAALAFSACAPAAYMGISLKTGGEPADLQDLARSAQTGDKRAQLELGIRFENGDGVPKDLERALRLYRMAANDSGGVVWIYVPPSGNGSTARTISQNRIPARKGLEEAKIRIKSLKE